MLALAWMGCVGDAPVTTSDGGSLQGGEGQPCYANGTCDGKLTCASKVCVALDSGGGNDAGADVAKPDAGAEAAAPVTCSQYCTAVNSACPLAYDPTSACLPICTSALILGASGDTSTNTVGCRIKALSGSPQCEVAGPLGTGQGGPSCGNGCDAYCDIAAAVCPTQYPSKPACSTWCAGTQLGAPGTQTGNTLNCRMHWLVLTASGQNVCGNTAMTPNQVCN